MIHFISPNLTCISFTESDSSHEGKLSYNEKNIEKQKSLPDSYINLYSIFIARKGGAKRHYTLKIHPQFFLVIVFSDSWPFK